MNTSILNAKRIFILATIAAFSILLLVKISSRTGYTSIPYPEVSVGVDEPITLYRGIPINYPGFSKIESSGIITPRGGIATPLDHNERDTKSNYTSWTPRIEVAYRYATMNLTTGKSCSGIILVKLLNSGSSYIQSPDIHAEEEYLLKGIVNGCIVIPVNPGMNIRQLDRLISNIIN